MPQPATTNKTEVVIDGVFVGRARPLQPDGHQSAIVKELVLGPIALNASGLAGDEQADRRYHGGRDKALHYFPLEHYMTLADALAVAADQLTAGMLGENLSGQGISEDEVCLGDQFILGDALIQVTEPRRPCWKIDQRLGLDGASRLLEKSGRCGWYFRVLGEGYIRKGDICRLESRPNPSLRLSVCHRQLSMLRPELALLRTIAQANGISSAYRRRIAGRLKWLEQNDK